MSWTLERLRDPASCERLIRETNAFIRLAYTRENTLARRSYVYEFTRMETFAFALQCPGRNRDAPPSGLRRRAKCPLR